VVVAVNRAQAITRIDTGEEVSITGPMLADGRVLVQGPTGLPRVIDVHQLTTSDSHQENAIN
jgi:hypothetical protein